MKESQLQSHNLNSPLVALKMFVRWSQIRDYDRLVTLRYIHYTTNRLSTLEKKIEQYSLESHEAYRVYISAEPAGTRDAHIIPQGILESSIKITNEPPTGMFANLHKALYNFNQVRMHNQLCHIVYLLSRFITSDEPILSR